jgi:hypothetical protein
MTVDTIMKEWKMKTMNNNLAKYNL